MAEPSITRFFVEALASAIDLGMATPDDVIKHATPDVLAKHLPRPIWSKLIAACLAAPRTNAELVVDTIGMVDLCEHVPKAILWACLAEIGQRALGKSLLAMAPAPTPEKIAVGTSPGTAAPTAPPPSAAPTPIPASASQPIATHVPARAQTEPPAPLGELPPVGGRAPTGKPAVAGPRAVTVPATISTAAPTTSPGNGVRNTAGASSRRPQAAATPTPTATPPVVSTAEGGGRDRKGPRTAPPSSKRPMTTNADFEIDTDVSEWKSQSKPEAVVVDDDLVDWAQAEETATGGVDLERKR